MIAPHFAVELRRTVANYDAADCLRALRAAVEIYRSLRSRIEETESGRATAQAVMEYVSTVVIQAQP